MRDPVVVTLRNEASPWGISAAVVLHALLAATLALIPLPKPPKRLEEERVSVDILTPQRQLLKRLSFEVTSMPSAR